MGNLSSGRFQYDYWLAQSQAMYDDGVITYRAPKGGYRKAFRQLERKTGLNFERVKSSPEIDCIYQPLEGRAGNCVSNWVNGFTVYTDPDYLGYHVEAHEIGHALGLAHVDHDRSVMSIDWNYTEPRFTAWDLDNIRTVYDL